MSSGSSVNAGAVWVRAMGTLLHYGQRCTQGRNVDVSAREGSHLSGEQ